MFSYLKTLRQMLVSDFILSAKASSLFLIGLIFYSHFTFGQKASDYNFSSSTLSNAFNALSSPSTFTFRGSGNDRYTTDISIGFAFRFAGVSYTTFAVSENGWMTLGSDADPTFTNSLNTASPRPILAPLWDDLKSGLSILTDAKGDGSITYLLTGSPNDRVLTVQWLKFFYDKDADESDISFQVKLYEKGNKIEFIYKHEKVARATTTAGINNSDASIGIAGQNNGDFISISNVTATTLSSSTITEKNDLKDRPLNNSIYTFTPPPTITIDPSNISGLEYCTTKGPSVAKSFKVSAFDLKAILVIAAPTNFQISTDNTNFYNSIDIVQDPTGKIASQDVWVRLASGLSANNYSGNVSCASTDANTVNVAVSGVVKLTPTISIVDPTPLIVDDPTSQTVCSGSSTRAIIFTGTTGSSYNWKNYNTSIGLSSATGTGNILAFFATNPGVATIRAAPVLDVCTGDSITATITVKVKPIVTVDPTSNQTQTVCSGSSTTAIKFTGTGSSYNWRNNNTSIGLSSTTGSGDISSFTATNTGAANVSATIRVAPVLDGCTGDSINVTITVKPSPSGAPSIDGPAEVCQNAKNQIFKVNNPLSGVSYTWTKLTSNISDIVTIGSNNGQTAIVSFSNSGNATIRLEVTDNGSGCKKSSNKVIAVTTNASLPADVKVIYNGSDFVCLYNLADSLQWGYDDVNLIPQDIPNEVAQNYYLPNVTFNNTKYYWVKIFTAGKSCNTRFYYNSPAGRFPEPPLSTSTSSYSLRIFPNPVQSSVMVQWDGAVFTDDVTIVITDLMGRILLIKEAFENINHQIGLPVSHLESGTYFIKITGNNGKKAVSRLLKM